MNVILPFVCFFINYKMIRLATRPSNWTIATDCSMKRTLAVVFTEKGYETRKSPLQRPLNFKWKVCRMFLSLPISDPCLTIFPKIEWLLWGIFLHLDFFGVRASLTMTLPTDFRPCRRIGSSNSRKRGDPLVALTNLSIWWDWTAFIPLGIKRIFFRKMADYLVSCYSF